MIHKLVIAFLLFFCIGQQAESQKTRRALIIAIGNYDFEKTKWRRLNVDNDVPLIREVLRKQNFPDENIATLKDEAATKVAISDALDKLAGDSEPGDVVVIHVSAHGQQLEDDGNDEVDKYDEAIVPYGAVYSSDPREFQKYAEEYFRDDLFGEKVTAIRNKIGSNGDLLITW